MVFTVYRADPTSPCCFCFFLVWEFLLSMLVSTPLLFVSCSSTAVSHPFVAYVMNGHISAFPFYLVVLGIWPRLSWESLRTSLPSFFLSPNENLVILMDYHCVMVCTISFLRKDIFIWKLWKDFLYFLRLNFHKTLIHLELISKGKFFFEFIWIVITSLQCVFLISGKQLEGNILE